MVQFDDRGLIPAIVQDADTGRVLTLAYMDIEALHKTISGPDVWFYSRSRQALWHKGETSGNYLKVKRVNLDCDGDAVLVQVEPTGPACHEGTCSCFDDSSSVKDLLTKAHRTSGPGVLTELVEVIRNRRTHPRPESYTSELLNRGVGRAAQKVIEEAGETAIAALNAPENVVGEMADLLYHALVLLEATNLDVDRVWDELLKRRS